MKIRKPLKEFAEFQEKILQEHDRKGGWEDCDIDSWLFPRLDDEVSELERALENKRRDGEEGVKAVLEECADVANFAMMIYDLTKGKNNVIL